MLKRRAPWVAGLAMIALLAVACGDDAPESAPPRTTALAFGEAAGPSLASRTIEVSTSDELSFSPDSIDIAPGEIITFSVRNNGRIPHEFVIGDDAEQERHDKEMLKQGMGHDHPYGVYLEPGETKELTWRFPASGEFSYACHVPGHFKAGMVGNFNFS